MRIATNSASEAMLARIQKLSARQAQLQTQTSTGQKIFNPEDDPAAMGRILNWNNERSLLDQYGKNANRALDLSQATYSAIQELKKISDRAGELVTLGAGASSPDAFRAYAKEVNQLVEQSIQLANTQFRNDYIFSGTAVDKAPIAVTTQNASGEAQTITYNGNANQIQIQLSESSTLAPGAASTTTSGITQFIKNLISLRDALEAGSSTAVNATQTGLLSSENMLVDSLSEHGAIQMRIEVSQRQQTSRTQNIEKLISDTADADLSKTVVELNQASTAYQAALASGTKILQMSILDYLR